MHVSWEKVLQWRRNVLAAVGAGSIVGTYSRFDQWVDERKPVHLLWSLGFLVAGCLTFYFAPDRALVMASSFGVVALLGPVNAVLSWNFIALPLILFSAALCVVALWWYTSRPAGRP